MVHVPRTAGDSLTGSLYGRFLGHFTLRDFLAVAPSDVISLPRFTVVRNPWSRLVSSWSFARAGGGAPRADGSRVIISTPEMYRGPVFDDFERFVNEWLVSQDFDRIDWIFQSQSHFVTDKTGSISFDHTGRFEDLPATAEWISHIVSRDIALTQTNRSSTGHYRQFYTPKTRDLVAEIYKQDVEQLQYDF